MIKGINHTMIELSDTGNEYYERAILIIRPVYASAQRAVLEQEARRMLKNMDAPAILHRRKPYLRPMLIGIGCLVTGLLTGFFLH
ncbi:MAG: hypothetical protein VZR73_04740 [Acutalibacteraceae bacterium]|nr:hypothetical protein [Clostridia bacterium]MEE3403373.1 hypothetical protein [Acutalibacteraceae bacterium]HCA56221.1 hypothetical protein [Oscillospiraceae bacterium]